MALTTGTRIGPYEIVSLLGAGGMGEVYRARDERLSRDVAVKVLPSALIADPDRLKRFEQEARAAGQINHPNIMAIYDVGTFEGTPYIVSEFIEGEPLREVLDSGPLPASRAIEIAIEIASGLAAAHAKGIVHRDLKPENLILLRDGRVKILDFGIAKLTRDGHGKVSDTGPTLANLTVTGQLLGTASYMAPEQIRDHGVDHRADLFTLGAILYEMVAGAQAFPGETIADRMSAILRADLPALPATLDASYPGLGKVLRRCLEKHPDARIDSARDLALALELVLGGGGTQRKSSHEPLAEPSSELDFTRLTFRDGLISEARFTPDGKTVVYSAAWEGEPFEIYVARVEMPESRPIGLTHAHLLSVASTSELAIALDVVDVGGFILLGTVARVSMLGGVPRQIVGDVYHADWSPDGKNLAVIRDVEGSLQLEYPVGRVLYRPGAWLSHLRVSRDGNRIVLMEHPIRGDNGGSVVEVDRNGNARTLSTGWHTLWGMAWSPDGGIWFTGHQEGRCPGVYKVSGDGAVRSVLTTTGFGVVHDVNDAGDVLFAQGTPRMKMEWRSPEDVRPRDLSWLDWSLVRDISPDGKWIVFDETGVALGGRVSVYMRSPDGSPAVRLGDGIAMEFSPDTRWALCQDRVRSDELLLYPTKMGDVQVLPLGKVSAHYATWFPDGKALCVAGSTPGSSTRLFRYDLAARKAEPISEEGVGRNLGRISPDGRYVIASDPAGGHGLYPTAGGAPRHLETLQPGERPHQWSPEGDAIYAYERGKLPCRVFRIDLATGKRDLWLEVTPRNLSGVDGINSVVLSSDRRSYAASYTQALHALYLARGLR